MKHTDKKYIFIIISLLSASSIQSMDVVDFMAPHELILYATPTAIDNAVQNEPALCKKFDPDVHLEALIRYAHKNGPDLFKRIIDNESDTNRQHRIGLLNYLSYPTNTDDAINNIENNMRAYKARSNGEDEPHYQYFFGTARLNCTYPLKVFVLQGIHINTQVNGHFLLLDASRADNKYMVQFLLMCQFPINTQNDNGLTSLHGASYEGHENIVKLLLSHKADPNIKDNDGNTPLMIASLQGHTSIVELLTAAGAR